MADLQDPRGSLRSRIWKLMLGVESLHPQEYLRYVSMGPCEVSTKSESLAAFQLRSTGVGTSIRSCGEMSKELIAVKNDTFRTLATDKEFKGKVDEDMLIRLLEAFIWKSKSKTFDDLRRGGLIVGNERSGLPFTYVQGMSGFSLPHPDLLSFGLLA